MTFIRADALTGADALRGMLEPPSDKSIAHRALICAALAEGDSRIWLREPGADVRSTLGALSALGVMTQATDRDDGLEVFVRGLGEGAAIGRIGGGLGDCGNSGTSMRLLMGALASGAAAATLIGDESLVRRPMARVAEPLRRMGADIDLSDGGAPVVVRGRRPLRAVDHVLNVASAQLVGALALAGLAATGVTTIRVPGAVRDHTERLLRALGAEIERTDDSTGSTTTLHGPAALSSFELVVPGDFSSAAAWLVAASMHREATLTLTSVGLNPTRTALIDVLLAMGADIEPTVTDHRTGEPVGDIVVRGGRRLRAVSLGAAEIAPLIDELPLLAVAMATADGTSEVRGATELRVKESDRIATMAAALNAAGATVEELPDGWRISRGRPLHARVETRGDHRVAMAMAVAAWTGVAKTVDLDDPACVAVSYPSFWDDARRIGASA